MLGVLLESQAQHQRRKGGAALSVAMHVAIVGVVTAATATVPVRAPEKPPVIMEVFRTPRTPPAQPSNPRPRSQTGGIIVDTPRLPVITAVPPTIPSVDLGAPSDLTPTDFARSAGTQGLSRYGSPDLTGGDGTSSRGESWSGSETLMNLIASTPPRYPERMRTAGVNGRVRIRFVVDTTGRVDLSSVQVMESTNDQFTSAVREVLPGLRFKPSQANGQRIRSLAEMPFEFQITR